MAKTLENIETMEDLTEALVERAGELAVRDGYATCPLCAKKISLRVDGSFNKHGHRHNPSGIIMKANPCRGSGKTLEQVMMIAQEKIHE